MSPGDVVAWCVGAALMGAAAVVFYIKLRELFLVRMPRDAHRRWTADLQADAEALIRAELHVAELQCQIAERIGKLPDQFIAPAFLASRLGYAIERAVVEEAKRVLARIDARQLAGVRRIQGFDVTGMAAIFDSVPHFRGHTQEIVHMTRLQLGDAYKFAWTPSSPAQGAPKE